MPSMPEIIGPSPRPSAFPLWSAFERLASLPIEAMVWIGSLVFLYLVDPASPGRPDLCLFHRLIPGLPCPGCGLGAAIHDLMHGEIGASLRAHPLGAPALLILVARVHTLLRENHEPRRRRGRKESTDGEHS